MLFLTCYIYKFKWFFKKSILLAPLCPTTVTWSQSFKCNNQIRKFGDSCGLNVPRYHTFIDPNCIFQQQFLIVVPEKPHSLS